MLALSGVKGLMRANVVSSAQHDTLKSYFLSKLRGCFTIVTFIA